MKEYTLIVARDPQGEYLFCKRRKMPWKGLYNFLGGKLEEGETPLQCAVREFREESNYEIPESQFKLISKLEYFYKDGVQCTIDDGIVLWVYAIDLTDFQSEMITWLPPIGIENPIQWLSLQYYDTHREEFAGEGNIGMLIRYYERVRLIGKKNEISQATS